MILRKADSLENWFNFPDTRRMSVQASQRMRSRAISPSFTSLPCINGISKLQLTA
jgi:hypothetical protein